MQIVLKPFGIVTLLAVCAVLAYFTFRPMGDNKAMETAAILPGDTLVNAAGQSRTVGKMEVIYDDALQNEWQIWNWKKKNYTETAAQTDGGSGKALTVTFDTKGVFEGVTLHHDPFDSAPYDRLVFRVHGGPTGGQHVNIVGLLRGKAQKPFSLAPLPANTWTTVTVSLKDLGIANRFIVDGFYVQNASNASQSPFTLDNIRLLTPKDK